MPADEKRLYDYDGLPIGARPEDLPQTPLTIFYLPTFHCVITFSWAREDFVMAGVFTNRADADALKTRLVEQTPELKHTTLVTKQAHEWIEHFFASAILGKFYKPLMALSGLEDPEDVAEERRRQDGLLYFDWDARKWDRRDRRAFVTSA
jgi:hypothetical protein